MLKKYLILFCIALSLDSYPTPHITIKENMPSSSFFAYGTNVFVRLIESASGSLYADKICTHQDWALEKEFDLAIKLYKDHPNWISKAITTFKVFKQMGSIKDFYGHGLRMEAYTHGSLANVIEQNEMGLENTSDYEYAEYEDNLPKNQLPTTATVFYLANAALIIDKLHNSNISWEDTKPGNFLLNDKGYLIASDFGMSKQTTDSSCHHQDWQDLGRRVAKLGFNAHKSDSEQVRSFVKELEEGKITNLSDVMNHHLFEGFNWEKLENQTLETPFESQRNSTRQKILTFCDKQDYLNM